MSEKDKIVLDTDDEAATYRTGLSGWVSRNGDYCGHEGEKLARYLGCTHRLCKSCGSPAPKPYLSCDACRRKAELDRYAAMPIGEWDGKAMVYSDRIDEFYNSPGEAEEAAEADGIDGNLRLILCRPVYAPHLDDSFFANQLPGGQDTPGALQDAIDSFNKSVSGLILSWEPGKYRLSK